MRYNIWTDYEAVFRVTEKYIKWPNDNFFLIMQYLQFSTSQLLCIIDIVHFFLRNKGRINVRLHS